MSRSFKIAIVVQQCGTEVLAGAERYALNLALALAKLGSEVEVLTTQSSDYLTWRNTLPKEEKIVANSETEITVHVRRFPNRFRRRNFFKRCSKLLWLLDDAVLRRRLEFFSDLVDRLFLWAQGPWCPELIKHLKNHSKDFDLIIFKSYLYAPCVYGMQAVAEGVKTLFIPAAHPELAFYRPFVGKALSRADALGFVSHAEQELVESCWLSASVGKSLLLPPGLGNEWQVSAREGIETHQVRQEILSLQDYFLVLGRIDKGKNLEFIFKNTPPNVLIVFAGAGNIPKRLDERFMFLGRVSELEKLHLLTNATALLAVSKNEAFSISTAEAMAAGCPVIGFKESRAVCELIERYGGLKFGSGEEFQHLLSSIPTSSQHFQSAKLAASKIQSELSWAVTGAKVVELVKIN